jgi:CRP-like cAMP-binding protein
MGSARRCATLACLFLQDHRVEIETVRPLRASPEPSTMPHDAPGRLRRARADAMPEVRTAWQAVLGPAPLPPLLLDQLLLLSNVTDLAAGQTVMTRRDGAHGLRLLVQGDVGVGVIAAKAPFQLERSVHAPAWLDSSSAWLGGTHAHDAVALSDARVVDIARGAYQTLMARHPDLALRTVVGLARQVHALTGTTQDLMHKDAQARLAAWLVQRCGVEEPALHGSRIVLRERKRDIASQLAITPETLSRLLRHLRRDGVLDVHGYTIEVLDPQRLRACAAG